MADRNSKDRDQPHRPSTPKPDHWRDDGKAREKRHTDNVRPPEPRK